MHVASAKIRSGPPTDESDDYALPIWAGVLPASITLGPPVPNPRNKYGVVMPDQAKGIAHLSDGAWSKRGIRPTCPSVSGSNLTFDASSTKGHEVGMGSPQAVTGPIDLDNDRVVRTPFKQSFSDNRGRRALRAAA